MIQNRNIHINVPISANAIVNSTVEFQWLENLRDYENTFETGEFELMRVNHSTRTEGKVEISFRFSLIQYEGILCALIRIASSRRF